MDLIISSFYLIVIEWVRPMIQQLIKKRVIEPTKALSAFIFYFLKLSFLKKEK